MRLSQLRTILLWTTSELAIASVQVAEAHMEALALEAFLTRAKHTRRMADAQR